LLLKNDDSFTPSNVLISETVYELLGSVEFVLTSSGFSFDLFFLFDGGLKLFFEFFDLVDKNCDFVFDDFKLFLFLIGQFGGGLHLLLEWLNVQVSLVEEQDIVDISSKRLSISPKVVWPPQRFVLLSTISCSSTRLTCTLSHSKRRWRPPPNWPMRNKKSLKSSKTKSQFLSTRSKNSKKSFKPPSKRKKRSKLKPELVKTNSTEPSSS
jgi:hypothetical protein